MANNQFLVSVADAIIRDPNTLAGIMVGTANLDSALTMTMAETEVRGGINNPLLYVYKHDKKIAIKITQATFDKNILALNAGSNVLNGTVSVVASECYVLSSGSATMAHTPTGNVTIFFSDNTLATVTPTGSVVSSGTSNDKVTCVYTYNETADRITVETITPPTVVDLTLKAEVRDNTGIVTDYLYINIPRYQVAGNYTLSLTANGVSNQALEGSALAVASADCTTGEYYATVTWVSATGAAISVTDIAATPSYVTFSAAAPASEQLTTWGLRGGLYSNVNVTTSCSYIKASGSSTFTVGLHTGLVTCGSAPLAGWSGCIVVSYDDSVQGIITDNVQFMTTA
jgi:hypothetical protein